MLFLGAILEMAAKLKSYAMGPLPILFSRSKCTILEVLTLLSLNPRLCQILPEICSTKWGTLGLAILKVRGN